ncbi:properdin-like [Ranitomeya variabilis]|uniref:properdin-like n=1 Tax=Ranitomeya variabilis TaxID=490064 RepID=UPI004055E410
MVSLLLLLLSTSILQTAADTPNVHCFAEVNEQTGECEDYLGEGVSDIDCCLNIKYGYKLHGSSSCVGCRPAEWSQWSDWTPCTVSCMEGVQQRQRVCIGEGDCLQGESLEVRSCSLQDCCPQVGGWSSWSSWTPCSVTCRVGQRQRTRECTNPPPSCNADCPGHRVETEQCDTYQICPTHGSWGTWGSWNPCSSNCIREGSGIFPIQPRYRDCDSPPPSVTPPGRACDGSRQDTKDCRDLPFCAIDGSWGEWQPSSDCSVTCGVGRITQKRSCDNPAPRYGGRHCVGSPVRQSICNTKVPCPVDGRWSEWTEWSKCSVLSNDDIRCKSSYGNQNRHRECQGQRHEGKWCEGSRREGRACYYFDRCKAAGSWTEWSEWGLCSSPCGRAEKTRSRDCEPIYPDFPTVVHGATKVVDVFFSGIPKVKCDAINGETLKVEEKTECRNLPSCT